MELEFFCEPGTDLEWFRVLEQFRYNWLRGLGMTEDELRARDHEKEELSHYSRATTDLEFLFPFGWGELWGIADRTDYDLRQHQDVSKQDLTYFDDEKKRNTSHMSLSRLGERTAWFLRSSVRLTMRKN